MINRTEAEAAILAQLQVCIPALYGSILNYLDKPREMSLQVIEARHPKGLMLVQYDESQAGNKTEIMLICILCVAISQQQVVKLCDAVREALNELLVKDAHRFSFYDDKPVGNEEGIYIRAVRFSCSTPATPTRDRAATIAAMNL